MHKTIAITSDTPNKRTVKLRDFVRSGGRHVTIFTREQNEALISEKFIDKEATTFIYVADLDDPKQAADDISAGLARESLSIDNWISIPDSITDTFIYTCDKLGLAFPFLDPYVNCRIKPLTRSLVGDVRHVLLQRDDLEQRPELPFPLIAKPITGTASLGVVSIQSVSNWSERLKRLLAVPCSNVALRGFHTGKQFMVEEMLGGTEYEIDGFIHAGKLEICAVGYKHHGETQDGFRELGGVTYRWNCLDERELVDREISHWTAALLDKLRFTSGTFHIEAMIKDAHIRLIEINPRPGGGGVQPIVKQLSDVDLMQECVNLWLGLPPSSHPRGTSISSIAYAILYPWKRGRIRAIASERTVQVPLVSGGLAQGVWIPLLENGSPVEPSGREQYVGELHLANQMFSEHVLRESLTSLTEWLRGSGLVDIEACDDGVPKVQSP